MNRWRTGGHWGRTIVIEGDGEPDAEGRRAGDELIGLMDDPTLAWVVVNSVNKMADAIEGGDAV